MAPMTPIEKTIDQIHMGGVLGKAVTDLVH